ncbi:MAG TPA: protein kinase [Acidimicrobiales bacterium]|nr:protein kinase [Acidimicrobiales bacterium]
MKLRPPRRQPAPAPTGATTFPGFGQLTMLASSPVADVYRAVEVETDRTVALKALKLAPHAPHVMEAFAREVKALGALSTHPHIVTLFRTVTSADGRPTLVLELCRRSLADRLRQDGPLPAPEAVSTGIKIAGALESAHRAGLLHRDVKPHNILVTAYGEPALADFGLADLHALTQAESGVIGFTTLHAAPEVLEGHPLSPATDVYGLASTMYQLLAGRAPFAAYQGEAPAAVILRILRDPPVPLRDAAVPLALADVLTAALAKSPAGRPASAAELAEQLRAVEAEAGWAPTSYVVRGAPAPARSATGPALGGDPPPAGGPALGGDPPPAGGPTLGRDAPPAGHAGTAPPLAAGGPLQQASPAPSPGTPSAGAPRPGAHPSSQGVVTPAASRRNVVNPNAVGPGAPGQVRLPPPVPAAAEPGSTTTPPPAAVYPGPASGPPPATAPGPASGPPAAAPGREVTSAHRAFPEPAPAPTPWTPAPAVPATGSPAVDDDPYQSTVTASGLAAAFRIGPLAPQDVAHLDRQRRPMPWALIASATAFAVAVTVLILVMVGVI